MHSCSNSDKKDLQVFTNLHQRYDLNSISSFSRVSRSLPVYRLYHKLEMTENYEGVIHYCVTACISRWTKPSPKMSKRRNGESAVFVRNS